MIPSDEPHAETGRVLGVPLADPLAALCGRAACRGFVATQQDKRDLIWLRNNLSRLMGDEDLSFYVELSRVSSILFDEFGETSHQTCSGHLREGIATLHARIATLEAAGKDMEAELVRLGRGMDGDPEIEEVCWCVTEWRRVVAPTAPS